MPILTYLDLSTGHITDDDNRYLTEKNYDFLQDNYVNLEPFGFRIVPHQYGWFVSVPDIKAYDITPDEFKDMVISEGLSTFFADIILYAQGKECKWINLDCDADYQDDLPTFEW